jgi:L-iditol 2-dehydrogenase
MNASTTVPRTTAKRSGAVAVARVEGAVAARHDVVEPFVPGPGQLLVRPAFVGVCGSDLEQFADHTSATSVINDSHIAGHEWSGETVEVGHGVIDFEVGDRVIGHGDLGDNRWFGDIHDGVAVELVAVESTACLRLPAGMHLRSAVLLAPFACVVEAFAKTGGVNAAHRVHVHGLSTIGLCAVILAAAIRASVVAIDPSARRRQLALSLGAEAAVHPARVQAVEALAAKADVVVEASGSPLAQAAALESAAPNGWVLFLGVSLPREAPARLGLIQERSLTVTSCTGTASSTLPKALRIIERHHLDLAPIASATFPFADPEQALARAVDRGRDTTVLPHP